MPDLAPSALSTVIVDDEPHCSVTLAQLLGRNHPEVRILGSAQGVEDGLALVRQAKPQLLFLDVELGDSTGFELLEALGPDCPHVVFTTAHEGYAVKAIRFSALDFLLKPIDPEELGAALERVRLAMAAPPRPDRFLALMQNMLLTSPGEQRIALPVSDGLEMVETHKILYCESDRNYTLVHLAGAKPLLITRTLKDFEDLLPSRDFIRVHHHFLINVHHVRKYIRGEGGEVVMGDGVHVAVSRRRKQELMGRLSRL
jgi:two-component system LytT family response regulator